METNWPLLPGMIEPETASLVGQFIARWSFAEMTLLMPLAVAMNSSNQGVLASILSSANSTEGKIKLVTAAVENMISHLDRKEPIKKALNKLNKLCEERNAICHHTWAFDHTSMQSKTIDYRKPIGDSKRITHRTDDDIRKLCNRTVLAAKEICIATKSTWITNENVQMLLLPDTEPPS